MIIQFTGAQSTGKTEVSEYLVQHFGFISHRESAREAKDLGFAIDKDATDFDQCFLNLLLLEKFLDTTFSVENFVFDRSFICCYAYAIVAGINGHILDHTAQLIKKSLQLVSRTFYFPLTLPYVADGVRRQDSREDVDRIIKDTLQRFEISFIEVPYKTVEDRSNFIIANSVLHRRKVIQ